jgi:hypothetical protein
VDVSTIFQNTIVEMLNAHASIFAPEEGSSCVHEHIIRSGCKSDVFMGTSFVFMYANCGSKVGAWRVFNKMSSHDMVTWNAILGGCAMLEERSKRCHLKMWSLGPP